MINVILEPSVYMFLEEKHFFRLHIFKDSVYFPGMKSMAMISIGFPEKGIEKCSLGILGQAIHVTEEGVTTITCVLLIGSQIRILAQEESTMDQ